MSTLTPTDPDDRPSSRSSKRRSERFEELAQLEQERRDEEARSLTRQRVEDAENLSKGKSHPNPELEVDGEASSGGSNRPPSPRASDPSQSVSDRIAALQQYRTPNDNNGTDNSDRHSSAVGSHDETTRPEDGMSLYTANSRPAPSPRSNASVATVKDPLIEVQYLGAEEEHEALDVDSALAETPHVQELVKELKEVKLQQSQLERNLDEAKREIDDLNKKLEEAEDEILRAPGDPTKSQAYETLHDMFCKRQSMCKDLREQLSEAEKREKELKSQLKQAEQELKDNGDTIERLSDELVAAKHERDLEAQRASALQYQLNDCQHQRDVEADHHADLRAQLEYTNQELQARESHVAELEDQLQLQQRRIEGPSMRSRRRGTAESAADDVCSGKASPVDDVSRKRRSIEKRGDGNWYKVRRK